MNHICKHIKCNIGMIVRLLSVCIILTTGVHFSYATDFTDVKQALQEVYRLGEAPKYQQAINLCDSIRADMDMAFRNKYDREVVPVRMEYTAHSMKLKADKEHQILLRYFVIITFILCAIGIVLFFFIRKENKKVVKSEETMKEATLRAELAEKSKSMFLSNMTHEIRTPLNAIAGFSDVLTFPDLDADVRKEAADIIEMNSNLLQNLIEDVVNTACLDLDTMKFRMVACDVIKICRNVTEMVDKIKKTSAEMSFETNIDRLTIIVDPLRLQQVLVNVLVNATKFCKQGSIVLKTDNRPEERMVYFSVTDTGIGIPKEKQDGVFKRFERVRENAEGFGLGLSICQYIVERFGGKIWVDPDYTDGARFIFTLPYGEAAQGGAN